MSFGALTAVGACVQILKVLYDYYDTYKRNAALLDILEGFSQNLEIGIERLKAREELFGLEQNDALDSIERDFGNAKEWLIKNDKNLRSKWTALQAQDKLRDLDQRLTKAFATKMSIAIFSALQDTRRGVIQIQTTLEGLPTNLETVCRTSTKKAIHEAIHELKEEAYQATGGGGGRDKGFRNGEAEKIISKLVDQLAEQERLKEEEEESNLSRSYTPLAPSTSHRPPLIPYASTSTSIVGYQPGSSSSSVRRLSNLSLEPTLVENSFEPSLETNEDPFGPTLDGPSRPPTRPSSSANARKSLSSSSALIPFSQRERIDGSIPFLPTDPITGLDLIDPVLTSDGLIRDRWSLFVDPSLSTSNRSTSKQSHVKILGDVTQLREAIFTSFPDRRNEFESRRKEYRKETIRMYDASNHTDLPPLYVRISRVVEFDDRSISMWTRRGIVAYRMRRFQRAKRDLTKAIEISIRGMRSEGGEEGEEEEEREPNLDALRMRGLVNDSIHDHSAALNDVEGVLSQSPYDVLALSLRAKIRASSGDIVGAKRDLASTNEAVRSERAYRSKLGDGECDLEYLTRGWAYSSVHDFNSAVADFTFSLSLRTPSEPYTTACRALATIKLEESDSSPSSSSRSHRQDVIDTAMQELDESIENCVRLAESAREMMQNDHVVVTSDEDVDEKGFNVGKDGLPSCVWENLLLRASARQALGEPQLALVDFELSLRLRPAYIQDVSSLRRALAEIRLECGDRRGARRDLYRALVLAETEGEREEIERMRDEFGL